MRSISKYEHCIECAKKCANQVVSMRFAMALAPTSQDEEVCRRKYERAVRHANKFVKLAYYYGGNK